ncbi:MAG TPA: hypothetical protein VES03_11735 [Motilibacterales bacterium]|nr:hypothetical protein [Motilibacterales bacterium]
MSVMGVRDLLGRFRPSGSPGPPAMSGVPADRVTERSAELEPVFAVLADVQAEVEQIGSEAQREALHRRERAAEQVLAILAEARRAVDAERAQAAATGQAGAAEQVAAIVTDAQAAAESLAEQADARRTALVADIVQRARGELLAVMADS